MNKEKTMIYKNFLGEEEKVYLTVSRYANNNALYLGLISEDGEPYSDITVNLNGFAFDECTYVDTNNNSNITKFIEKYKLGTYMGVDIPSGFCSYPMYSFDLKEIEKYCNIDNI